MATQNTKLRLVMVRRVSTVGQATDGYGLDAQETDCKRWNRDSTAGGHRLVHSVVDGDKSSTSGKSTLDEREGLMDAVQWIADGRADGILAPNLDRLARELTVQEAVLSYVWALGGRVFTADHGEHLEDDETDPMRTAMRQMRGVFQAKRGHESAWHGRASSGALRGQSRTAAVKAVQLPGEKSRAGPAGFLESRTASSPAQGPAGGRAVSTQLLAPVL